MIYTQVVPASHLTPACHPPCPPRSWPFPRTTQWPWHPGRPHVRLRMPQVTEGPVPGRRHEDHREATVIADEDGVGHIAEIPPWAGQHRRVGRLGHPVAALEVAAVVEQPTDRAAPGDRPQ